MKRENVRLSRELESFIVSQGADLVGVAPVERLSGAPEGNRPQDYMPEATCVISIGMHLQNGVCDVWGEHTQPSKSISPYLFYGYGLTNLELGRIANNVAKRLEHEGYKSLAFPPTWTISFYRWLGQRKGDLAADFSHRHAAVAAGLGEFGWSGLVLAPAFGTRVRFNSVITNAPLRATPLYDGPALCQPDKCGKLCMRVCPAEAYAANDLREVTIGGRRFQYAKPDIIRCQYGILGLVKGSGSIQGVEIPPGRGNWRHLAQAMKEQAGVDKALRDNCFGIICGDFCGRCLHQCPAHLYWKAGEKRRRAVGKAEHE